MYDIVSDDSWFLRFIVSKIRINRPLNDLATKFLLPAAADLGPRTSAQKKKKGAARTFPRTPRNTTS